MDIDKLKQERQCFKYQGVGHISRFCPNNCTPQFNQRQIYTPSPPFDVRQLFGGLTDEQKG